MGFVCNNICIFVTIWLCIKTGSCRFFIPIPDSSMHTTLANVELDELSIQKKRLQTIRWYNEYKENDDSSGGIDMKEQVMFNGYYTSILEKWYDRDLHYFFYFSGKVVSSENQCTN